MDVADLALDNDFTEAALRAHESGLQRRSGPSAMRCEECGDAIDERRARPNRVPTTAPSARALWNA